MNQFYKNISLWLVIVLMMVMLYNIFNQQQGGQADLGYSEFLSLVEDGRIQNVVIQGRDLIITDTSGARFNSYAPDDSQLIDILRKSGVSIKAKPPAESSWFMSIVVSWLPMIVLIGVWIFFMRQMQGGGGGGKAMSFGKSRARLMDDKGEKVTFANVQGIDEAKEELTEVVDFLKNPNKYTRLGGRIPKGVLLVGNPGTGKTLLSRAVAGEAGVPFFTISGSDFVEMFVGVGASRVRDLFAQGKKNAPCIIFIDEIDAVGRQRGAGLGGGHDEREQTLNQLLVEMDGFESNEGVILMAATNRADVLDPALLRPGRFDRQVVVDMPDIKGREGILRVHMKKSPLAKDVNPNILAKGTPGFSGADLENLCNEAALLAAKRNREKLFMRDFEDAKDKVYMGLERKSKVIKEDEKKTTAYHEGGHALVARFLPNTDTVNKITIIPRGRAAGVTWFLPEEGDFKYKDQLENELSIAFGGRVAEEIIFKRISTGASNDIKQATKLANRMVRSFGMSDNLAPVSYEDHDDNIFIGREMTQAKGYSEATAQKIDAEVAGLIKRAYDTAKTILEENIDLLHALTDLLLEKETVMGPELDDLIASLRPEFEFFGRRNIRTEPEPPKEEETPVHDEPKDVKNNGSDDDTETKDPDPDTMDSEASKDKKEDN
ncbi:cell division protein FtsH [Desulfobacter hydrogenophilus]|uniref:ATP-dependent zinc metalloprotease FtsH n=1 Tax=Desulfobacter hydrogenophilus TaxID=2291 RepID=A0A328FCD6_9BACT|nr:ATP-dependent zinc metalloprotease FtsH [Desulfobacter hydrogenophilus]NDY73427.1 ATP-dependent metallopeptidase FtsH/Yme1/Tma family protein [Desulfobacter hydrogenophilus]QBH12407.1 ATP-dependent metallopeptidase FtsH/Yme1/Tma family protein [Desulfobacter hydrogenophilus]RAM00755.1 cell division protein FtsH [Desulfobacter hydrogenophilus]